MRTHWLTMRISFCDHHSTTVAKHVIPRVQPAVRPPIFFFQTSIMLMLTKLKFWIISNHILNDRTNLLKNQGENVIPCWQLCSDSPETVAHEQYNQCVQMTQCFALARVYFPSYLWMWINCNFPKSRCNNCVALSTVFAVISATIQIFSPLSVSQN